MERRCLKKEIEKLLSDYVGIRLRENEFDPRGQRQSTFLDDMAHYNLALGVALLWLNDSDAQPLLTKEEMNLAARSRYMYPNRTEREAMILSSYAGILMNSIPVEDIFEIYSMRPSATCWQSSAKDHWIHPFNLSLHPFAMLTAPRAAEHAWKHSIKYQRAAANQKTSPGSTRRTKKDRKQLNSLTRRKQQDDKGATEAAKQGISPEKPGTNLKGENAKKAKA
ncbi:uncharacterized protein C2orf80 homolog [Apteryx mantelli]|uniref:Uncharacterized protein C2orf80 homolog n=1 Tax=Apteryx mantelli TaxID=2696672 RepID=A0A8B7JA79_9AVES|nr:uncharacterized protein C2orf80 homolog isoform X1 [Apteryx rowi]